jgi:hypothetical protein
MLSYLILSELLVILAGVRTVTAIRDMKNVCERRCHPTAVKWRAYVEKNADHAVSGTHVRRSMELNFPSE